MRHVIELTAGAQRFRNDHGGADPAVAAALAAFAGGGGTEQAALTALAASRLLVPLVALAADDLAEPAAGQKSSEMATLAIVGRDGRRALPAFTCVDALLRWRPDARPVPVPASAVWQSAVAESSAVIIDIAGPVSLAVDGSRLAALADGGPVPGMHEDPDVWHLAATTAGEIMPGIRVRLSPPRGGLDFTLELAPPEGDTGLVPEDAAGRIGEAVTARLASRARAGIAVVRRPAS